MTLSPLGSGMLLVLSRRVNGVESKTRRVWETLRVLSASYFSNP